MSTQAAAAIDYNPFDPDFTRNPYPVYERMRATAPVYFWELGQSYIVTRYEDAVAVCKDPRLSSNFLLSDYNRMVMARAVSHPLFRVFERSLFNLPAQDHARIRRLANPMFAPRSVERMQGLIRREVDAALDRLAGREQVDVARDLAEPVPRRIIVKLLGAPEGDEQKVERFATGVVNFAYPAVTDDDFDRNVAAVTEGFEMVRHLIERLRKEPGDDILSTLIQIEEDGDRLSSEELLPLVAALLLGAWETTGQALAFAFWSLLRHPEQVALLRQKPDLIKSAVEETLRYDYFARHGAFRYAEDDLELFGTKVSKGQCVIGSIAGAHRDPSAFPNPDAFDITRSPAPLLSFGGGPHVCIGMALGRLVMQAAVGAFVQRFPAAALAGEPAFDFHPLLRKMSALPVRLGAA